MVKLVHGIRSMHKGVRTMGALQTVLESAGITSEIVSYGYVLIPVTNAEAVQALLDEIEGIHQPIIVAYSNGAWAAVQVAEMGISIEHLVLVNPALHKCHEFPGHVGRIDVFHSPGDIPTRAAKWWRWLTRIFPWRWDEPHGWGEMGRTGYAGEDPRVTNHQFPDVIGHSWFKYPGCVTKVAHVVKRAMRGRGEKVV